MAPSLDTPYQVKSEPSSNAYRRALWDEAFGLQQVDGITPSAYMRALADSNVCGTLSLSQVAGELDTYYRETRHCSRNAREEEADRVSHRIVELLEDGSFGLDPYCLSLIHRHLFQDLDEATYHPGAYKTEHLIKCEPILNGDSVMYGSPALIARSLQMLFDREMAHAYAGYKDGAALSWADASELCRFIAHIWMVHPFTEGNTRTVAVFLELYLRSMGFDVDNALFRDHAPYFRGALVRATYQNRPLAVLPDTSFLETFLSRLVEDADARLDEEALWCRPLFAHPERVRNVSLADASPLQRALTDAGISERVLSAPERACIVPLEAGACESKGLRVGRGTRRPGGSPHPIMR